MPNSHFLPYGKGCDCNEGYFLTSVENIDKDG